MVFKESIFMNIRNIGYDQLNHFIISDMFSHYVEFKEVNPNVIKFPFMLFGFPAILEVMKVQGGMINMKITSYLKPPKKLFGGIEKTYDSIPLLNNMPFKSYVAYGLYKQKELGVNRPYRCVGKVYELLYGTHGGLIEGIESNYTDSTFHGYRMKIKIPYIKIKYEKYDMRDVNSTLIEFFKVFKEYAKSVLSLFCSIFKDLYKWADYYYKRFYYEDDFEIKPFTANFEMYSIADYFKIATKKNTEDEITPLNFKIVFGIEKGNEYKLKTEITQNDELVWLSLKNYYGWDTLCSIIGKCLSFVNK